MKKSITLIELMVVIIALGILTAIAIPNIKNIKNQASLSNAKENKTNVQKGIDTYFLGKQTFPCTIQPTAGNPQQIDWTKLEPPYLLKKPADLDKMYYWIDVFGTVWMSDIDSPMATTSGSNGNLTVTFEENKDAQSYQVGYIDQSAAFRIIEEINADGSYVWRNAGSKASFTSTQVNGKNLLETVLTDDLTGKNVVVNAISKNGLATAPVTSGYAGGVLYGVNKKPTAIIAMTPDTDITVNTSIVWDYNLSTDTDGDSIVNYEWQCDSDAITKTPNGKIIVAGNHVMKLRVQDSRGEWSNWESKSFVIEEPIVFSGASSAAFDENINTPTGELSGVLDDITWTGNLTNKIVSITYQNVTGATLFVHDVSNTALSFVNIQTGQKVTAITPAGLTTQIIQIPPNAKWIRFNGTSNIYDITVLGNISESPQNVTATPAMHNITLTWDEPEDPNIIKAAIFKNNVFLAYANGTSYTDTLVYSNMLYNYSIQFVGSDNLRSAFVNTSATTLSDGIEFRGATEITFDGNVNTSTGELTNAADDITWTGDLSNRIVNVKYTNVSGGTMYVQDNSNNSLTFYNMNTSANVTSILVGGTTTQRIRIPNGATKIVFSGTTQIYEVTLE